MSRDRASLCFTLAVALAVGGAATGEPPSKEGRPDRPGIVPIRHNGSLMTLAFTRDGKWLLGGEHIFEEDREKRAAGLLAWDPATGRVLRRFGGQRYGCNTLALSPDGKRLASAGSYSLWVWNLGTGKVICKIAKTDEELKRFEDFEGIAFSPDGKTLASLTCATSPVGGGHPPEATLHLWEVDSGKVRRRLEIPEAALRLAWSPDGKFLAWGSDEQLTLWNVAAGQAAWKRKGGVYGLAFSPDGKALVVTGSKGVQVVTVKSGKVLPCQRGDWGWMYCVAVAPGGKFFAAGGSDGKVRVWDLATRKELRTLETGAKNVFALAFAPDGKTLATGGDDKRVRLWDMTNGKERSPAAGGGRR